MFAKHQRANLANKPVYVALSTIRPTFSWFFFVPDWTLLFHPFFTFLLSGCLSQILLAFTPSMPSVSGICCLKACH